MDARTQIDAQIQLRRDLDAVWRQVDPVLRDGEVAYSKDILRMKVGDGTSRWSELPYLPIDSTGGTVDLTAYAKKEDLITLSKLLASMWSIDEQGNLVTDNQVIIKNNLIVKGDTASGGEGGGTITEITSTMITEALGYIPANSASLGNLAYKSSLVASDIPSLDWSKITSGKPTTLAGYGITDAYTASSIDTKFARYLPLTGGTITGNGAGLLAVNRQDGNPVIEFRYNGSLLGRYGFATDGTPIGVVGGSQVTLIHSGNIGSQKVAGLATARTIWGQQFDGTGNVSGALTGVTSISLSNYFKISHEDAYQKIQTYGSTPLVINNEGNSVGIGTSAPSYKLHVIGTLGVSGVASLLSNLIVGGNLQMGNEKPLYFKDKDGNNKNGLYISTGNNMWLGYDNGTSIKACIVGSEVRLYYGGVSNIGLLLNSSGNVLIGTTTDLGSKLFVNGVTRASAFRSNSIGIECDADGNTTGYGSEINRFGSNLYLQTREGNLLLSHATGTTYIRGLASITGAVTMASTLNVGGASTFNGDVRINGNLIVTGDTASGGTGESNVGGPLYIQVVSIFDHGEMTGISQSVMDSYGLTVEVINNMLSGLYTKVVDVSAGTYNDVWNYSCYETEPFIHIFFNQGDGYDVSYGIHMVYNKSTALWDVTTAER